MSYVAPVADMLFNMEHVADLAAISDLPGFEDASLETAAAVLGECARFNQDVVAPLNWAGDQEPSEVHEGVVSTTPGFKAAFKQYAAAGWQGVQHPTEFGGQGLPKLLATPCIEMLNSASISFALVALLSDGAIEALLTAGSDEQKAVYLENLVSGKWTGTMNLTEPQAGSDLAAVRTRAVPQDDGTYKVFGTKIFITYGEHDMAENILHLVLARVPDAPEGSKGISLFLVPKFLPNADGSVGERNPITCGAIEEKMGIHGNSTCQMNLDGAKGWIIGQPNKGLNAMFVFMNAARLGVGMQSLGLTEIAYQNALIYAKDRTQMRSLSGIKNPELPADRIIVHPDVRRMLLTGKAYAEGARAFTSYVALQIDRELHHPDADVRKEAADEVALLTPVIKAFITDNAWIATSDAMQVFGGHGYISEWGMEQYVRDARINMIYEGTNTIQSLDLLGRKILGDNGAKLRKFGEKIKAFVEDNGTDEAMSEFVTPLGDLGDKVTKLTMEIGMKAFQNPDEVGAACVPYLRVVGHMIYSYLFAQMAKIALEKESSGDKFYTAKLATARFYFARLQPETATLIRQARSGSANLMALDADLF